MSEITTIGIVGAGTMGSGIAHAFARSGFGVLLCDLEEPFLARAVGQIRTNLGREAAKGKLATNEVELSMARIRTVTDRKALADADFVVEAAPERFELKAEIFRALDQNSSRERDSRFQHFLNFHHPTRCTYHVGLTQVIGMHFFNPVPVMALVEVVRGLTTSDSTYATVHELSVRARARLQSR